MVATERIPKRYLIDIRKSSSRREEAWNTPESIVKIALETLKKKELIPQETQDKEPDLKLLAKRIGRSSMRIVFDLFHDTLDVTKAHLHGQELPVVIVSMFRGKMVKTFEANAIQTIRVNFEIRCLFNCRGTGSEPPFSEDARQMPRIWAAMRDRNEFYAQCDAMTAEVQERKKRIAIVRT